MNDTLRLASLLCLAYSLSAAAQPPAAPVSSSSLLAVTHTLIPRSLGEHSNCVVDATEEDRLDPHVQPTARAR